MSTDVHAMAPPDQIYVCAACSRTSLNRSGFVGEDPGPYRSVAMPGWDESCMMHAVLCWMKRDERNLWVSVDGTTKLHSREVVPQRVVR